MSGVEVLGFLGTLAAASQLVEQSIKVVNFISDLYTKVHDAPESIKEQIVQIEQLVGIATLIRQIPSLQTDYSVASSLHRCQNEAKELIDIFLKLSVVPGDGKAKKLRKTLDWISKEKKILGHLRKLEQEKSSLVLCIATIDCALLHNTHLNFETIKGCVNDVSRELPGVRDTTRDMTTVMGVLPQITSGIIDLQKTLPDVNMSITIVHDELSGIQTKVAAIHNVLPAMQEAMQQLAMEQQASRLPTFSIPRTLYHVPNRRVHEFIGREDILNEINEGLSLGPAPRIVVLRGIGGQGKTQVALEYCHREKSNQFSAVFWIDATSESSLKKSFGVIAEYIEPATSGFSNIDNKATFALESLANWPRPWLLVFDNYDDPIAFNSLQDFIPIGKHGSIIITTRHADVDALGQDRRAIELHGLEEEDALKLLFKKIIKTKADYGMAQGKSIVRRLGYHPLAIAQASAYIRKRRINFEGFIDHYTRRRQLILEQIPQMSQYRRKLNNSDEETSLSVFTTWELSFLQLQALGVETRMKADFLTLFAFFNCKDISEKMFKNYYIDHKSSPQVFNLLDSFVTKYFYDGYDRDLFRDILSDLRDISLLQAFSEEADGFLHFSLHPLVKDWIRLRTGKEACRGYALLAADIIAQTIMLSWRNKQFEMPLSARQEILSHLDVQMDNYSDFLYAEKEIPFNRDVSISLAEAESWFGSFYYNSGWFKEAEAMHIKALRLREDVLGQQHSDTLTSISKVAQVLNSQGKHNEAETMHRLAFQLREEVLGQHHPDTLTSMHNLALVLTRQGKYNKAEALFRQTVLLREEILGQHHLDTLLSSSNLARVLDRQRKHKEAETIHQQTLQLRSKVFGQQHPHTLISMSNLALSLEHQDKYDEAKAIYQQVLQLREKVLSQWHPDILTTMSNLARVLNKQGEHIEAKTKYQQILQLRESLLGQQHPLTLIIRDNLALVLSNEGKLETPH